MIVTAEKDEPCAACGEVVATGARATWQDGPAGGRLTHRVCPGEPAGGWPVKIGPATWDTLDLVELCGFPPDEPIPLVLTAGARRALAWA